MENSEAQQKILALGKKIVKELELDPGVDTLAKWMAHFLAEKLVVTERLSGEEKKVTEKECFELILELWKHRWSIPSGKPFLKDFEPLFETLKQLNPNRETPYYLQKIDFGFRKGKHQEGTDIDKAANKFEAALNVDRLARSLICQLLHEAVSGLELGDEREQLVNDAIDMINNSDTEVIRFTTNYDEFEKAQNGEPTDKREERIVKLTERIKELEEFDSLKESLLGSYKKELQELEAEQ